jgi:ribosomal protein S18 acetylase RimI-like enzyme
MHIRRPTLLDRPAIERILRDGETFNEAETAVALELVDEVLAGGSPDYQILVAELESGMVGSYICFGKTPMTDVTWDLYWIASHPTARGQGLASRLVRAMEQQISENGHAIVRIETSQLESYGAARSFYERAGYAEVGRIPDFYRPADDLVIFARRVEASSLRSHGGLGHAQGDDARPAPRVAQA